MMDNMLYIIPYTKEHGQIILSYQMNHKILEADRHYINVEGDAKNLEQDHLAFTGDKEVEFRGDYDTDGFMIVRQTQPLPLTILSLYPRLVTNDG